MGTIVEASLKSTKYDLEERTGKFGVAIIEFSQRIPKNVTTLPLISQLIRAGTSIGANYCEADCAESRKDFEHKLGICKKEAKESKYWLEMVMHAVPALKDTSAKLLQEANELQLIFITIIRKSRLNSQNKN